MTSIRKSFHAMMAGLLAGSLFISKEDRRTQKRKGRRKHGGISERRQSRPAAKGHIHNHRPAGSKFMKRWHRRDWEVHWKGEAW